MNRTKSTYLLLFILFIITVCISIYYYQKVDRFDRQLKEIIRKDDGYSYRFTLIGEEMENEYWQLVGEGALEEATKHQIFLDYTGPRKSNPEEQLKLFDLAIYEQVDGIIVQALNDDFRPYIDKAIEHNIPVITIDTDIEASKRNAYIGSDNYQAGQMAAEALIQDTKGKIHVGIITGKLTSVHHQLRVKGFIDTIEKEKRINLVAVDESNITRHGAEEKAFNMLNENKEMNAIYGTSALDDIGIASAVISLNKEDDVYIIGFDPLAPSAQLVREGVVNALITQKPDEMGKESVQLMVDIIEGKAVESTYYIDLSIVRKDDLVKSDD